MALDPAELYGLAADVLAAIEAGYPAAPSAHALPDRRYVSDGPAVADDCADGALSVAVERMFSHAGDLAEQFVQQQPPEPSYALRGVTVAVRLVRCSPVDKMIAVADIEDAAEVTLADPIRLWNALRAAQASDDLAGCSGLAFESWEGYGPEGGLAGGVLRVRLGLG